MTGGDQPEPPGERPGGPWPETAFWTFSTTLYRAEGVEGGCLNLQRRHGLDVNLLLLACWLGASGRVLDGATAARLQHAAEIWQAEVVRPLRAVRSRLKVALADPEPGAVVEAGHDLAVGLRGRVLALELDAERVEQIALEAFLATPAPVAGYPVATRIALESTAANLTLFELFTPDDAHDLRALLLATCPDAERSALARAIRDLTAHPEA